MEHTPTRIVLLCTALNEIGGTSRHMAKIYNALDRKAFEPFIVFSSSDADRLMNFFLAEGCCRQSIRVVPVFLKNPTGVFVALRRVWRELKPNIVHSFFLHSDILSYATSAFNSTIVRVSSVEGKFIWDRINGVGALKNACYQTFNAFVRKSFAKTIAVSADLKNEVIASGADPLSVVVIPVGLPCVEEALLKPVNKPGLVVGCMARFSADKGVDLFLRAVALCAKDLPHVRFIAAGAGEDEAKLKALAVELGIDERVDFSGWVNHVTDFLNGIDVFVMPSRREGCPLALIEAMMHKKAVVAFDAPGVNEVIRDGETALISPAFDVAALANGIRRCVADEALRVNLGHRARLKALEDYSISKEIALIENVYLSTIVIPEC